MEDDTVEALRSLQDDLRIEMNDMSNQGDRVGAAIFQRLINAIERNVERRITNAAQAAELAAAGQD